ncbi:MAG: PaaI family thioesterase [Variovorax sp.]|nr:PaaI family thioesterase [Variovorax sp.]
MTQNPTTPATPTVATLQGLLAAGVSPWIQAMGLQVESFTDGEVTLRLPQNDQLSRVGGMLCGQAMMAAADTAMVLAIVTQLGDRRPMTTVQLNTSFLKPLSGQDARINARVIRAGKSLVFGEIDICGATDGRSVCRASTTYALL